MPRSAASSRAEVERRAFADAVGYYLALSPRQLPSRYLYDPLGSALFEAICCLPWYGITRTEASLLRAHAAAIHQALAPVTSLVELGPGSGDKLRLMLESAPRHDLTVHLVDVSEAALAKASRAVVASDAREVVLHQATYEDGLAALEREAPRAGRRLVLFLGSNIGNFDPPGAEALLVSIRRSLRRGDGLLLGTDLVKPERDLLLAYDDPLGVTAAFNRNLLVRANRELGADFILEQFTHRAVWNAARSRVEMHLVSTVAQDVRVPASGVEVHFGAGDTIWTESSYKFEPGAMEPLLRRCGFRVAGQWGEDGFALTLAEAVAA